MSALRAAFSPWRLTDEEGLWIPGEGVKRDAELGAEVSGGRGGLVRLWRSDRSLVVTRREARLPRFVEAKEAFDAEGWPVVVRDSGGTTVPHFPGALQVSLLLPRSRSEGLGVENVYHLLCEPVKSALHALGLETGYGEVAGSFCDGRFNLVHAGRKVAGTAQRWKGAGPGSHRNEGYILSHMVLFVEGDLVGATKAVNRFLELAGGRGGFELDAQETVDRALRRGHPPQAGGDADARPLMDRVRLSLRAALERDLGLPGTTTDG